MYKSLIDKVVTISDRESMYHGEWGVVVEENTADDEYHVAIANGRDSVPIFNRNQFVVRRDQTMPGAQVRSSHRNYVDFDQRDYLKQYDKNNIRRVVIRVNRKTMPDIAERIDTVDNVQGYILALIRKDISRASESE